MGPIGVRQRRSSDTPFGPYPEDYMNISIVAKVSLAIIAVVALVAMADAVTTGAADQLDAEVAIAAPVVVGDILALTSSGENRGR